MNNQQLIIATQKIQDTFLYYDPIYGTKYNKVKSGAFIASTGILGGAVGYASDNHIVGTIAGSAISAGFLWYVNKEKSQKPIDDREIKQIQNNLELKLNNNLVLKDDLSKQRPTLITEVNQSKVPAQQERQANESQAKTELAKSIIKYEEKFNKITKELGDWLVLMGIVEVVSGKADSSMRDGAKCWFAFQNFKNGKDGGSWAINSFISTLPEQVRKNYAHFIRIKLENIGSRPVLKHVPLGLNERKYIVAKNKLQSLDISYNKANYEIEEAKKIYTLTIEGTSAKIPNFDNFKKQMPN